MVRLKAIGVLSAGKISALLYGGLALLIAPILLWMAAYVTVTSAPTPNQLPGSIYLAIAIAAPFVYAAMGFITGAGAALIYNLAARWVGGLELHFASAASEQSTVSQPYLPS
jgi:hypothetical protein